MSKHFPTSNSQNGAPPPNYVAGRGRGAFGFNVPISENAGFARLSPSMTHPPPHISAPFTSAAPSGPPDGGLKFGLPPPGYVAGRGRGLGDRRREQVEALANAARKAKKALENQDNDDNQDADDQDGPSGQVDDGSKNLDDEEGGLFADAVYEEDDIEADKIYAGIDKRIESRRQKQREARVQEELEKYRRENPTIKQQFADLKRELSQVTEDEWANIPDIGDYSIKKRKLEKFTPLPDKMLDLNRRESSSMVTSVNAAALPSGIQSGIGTDLSSIGEGRVAVLGQRLDRATGGDSVSGQTTIDPKGYLTQMAGMNITSNSEIGDIKKARLLLKSVTSTNPKHAPGWIAAARLEEVAGRMQEARNLILEGCKMCPREAEVWLEAARLHPLNQAMGVLASAVKHVPGSVKIWLQAAALENEVKDKRKVLRKALELIPNSAKLWRAAIELEDPDSARILLSRAVECVPGAVDLWLALSKLETYEKARTVLNKAREALPAERSIWITAAKLEEANGGKDNALVSKVIERAVKALSIRQSIVSRDDWISDAKESETAGFPATACAIIETCLGLGIEEIDLEKTWLADAQNFENENFIEIVRSTYKKAIALFPSKKEVWMKAAMFEKRKGSHQEFDELLKKAVSYCPQAEALWLLAAEEKWKQGEIDSARHVLVEAFASNPDSEQIWLAAVKLEVDSEEYDRARILLQRARKQTSSARVYMKSALLERQMGESVAEQVMLKEGLNLFPQYPKLWLMLAQNYEKNNKIREARATYDKALENCFHFAPIWIGLSRLEEANGTFTKARAVLERARAKLPTNDNIWLESVRLEDRAMKQTGQQNDFLSKSNVTSPVNAMMARALKSCPQSGKLWAEAIEMEKKPQRKARSVDALKRCDKNAQVMIAVARLFWSDRKFDKAREWIARGLALDPDLGDAWAVAYAFEKSQENDERAKEIENSCVAAHPRHGERWCSVSKRPDNSKMTIAEILKECASTIKPM